MIIQHPKKFKKDEVPLQYCLMVLGIKTGTLGGIRTHSLWFIRPLLEPSSCQSIKSWIMIGFEPIS